MANVPDSSLKTWNDGDTLHASDYDQDRQILQVAINDNNTRIGNQETKTKNLATDGSDYTGTWKGLTVSQFNNMATSIKSKTWTATDGQTVFTLGTSDTPYIVGNNSTLLIIGGVEQTLSEGYNETNTTTITTTEGVALGTLVELRYFLNQAVTDTPIQNMQGYDQVANKTQPSWITATLQNGATNNDYPLSYRKDQFGMVHIKGNINVTGNNVFMTLPSGYRPANYGYMFGIGYTSTANGNQMANLLVGSDGTCAIFNAAYSSLGYKFYVTFLAEN